MFASILKNLRAESHISQAKLAEFIGVSPGNVSTWESGESKPGYAALYALAQFFDVSADYLLELSPPKKGVAEEICQQGIPDDNLTREKQTLSCDGSPLQEEEADLVAMYRLLPDHKKEDAFDMLYGLYQKHVERKKESIYWTYAADREEQKSTAASDGGSKGIIA